MKRAAALARRLAATDSRCLQHLYATLYSQSTATGGNAGRAAGAVAASAAAVATAQWALAEAAQQPHHSQQKQADAQQEESCAECSTDVQLEEQPVAISNSATAQAKPPPPLWHHKARAQLPLACTHGHTRATCRHAQCSTSGSKPHLGAWYCPTAQQAAAPCNGRLPCVPPLQWRVFTDMGRELVQQGRHGEAERYFKKAVEMARCVRGGTRRFPATFVTALPAPAPGGACRARQEVPEAPASRREQREQSRGPTHAGHRRRRQ